MNTLKDKCTECKKEIDIYDGIQVKDPDPKGGKYKVVCAWCFNEKHYEFVGQLRKP